MGNSNSALSQCLGGVANGRSGFVSYPENPLYQISWVKRYNLDVHVTPAAVVRPDTSQDIADIIKCATANKVKVQAKSGGHSYANFGLGGDDGAVAIDLVNLQEYRMDPTTWYATVGAGFRLGEVDKRLHETGRAFSHGVCPDVGIGGHATIGGLGPMSRMWGSCLDHIVEVEVVTADGKIQRASETENSDLFWALRGAGGSFGVITKFVMRTHPEPANVVQYSYTAKFGKQADMAAFFSSWQDLIANPNLDPRFGTLYMMMPLGAIINGVFYGTQEEFEATGIPASLPNGKDQLEASDWLGSIAHGAETEALALSNIASPFYSKSLGFKRSDLIPPAGIKQLFEWIDQQDKGTLLWALVFDAQGGATSAVAPNATAYNHRDKIMFYESFAVGFPLQGKTKQFLTNLHNKILQLAGPGAYGTYAGYVDLALGTDAQNQYWGANLPQLQNIKVKWDPTDVFHNLQSVQPIAS
ncbi:hypothetical protein B0H63DRAFT_76736 [Podospora didyma]|uniref:FAD-binding PCMH-type domain-containing protein n=1 Tax=Podospora didyma TaxID=330526 RepID=A0AAE0N3W5_9PEZI|nr:hypothetical protein B0H63DRAFT_76736 [Podospora didyma]